jgi:hypothetical protein
VAEGDKIRIIRGDGTIWRVLWGLNEYVDGKLWADKWTPDHQPICIGFPIKLTEEELKDWEIVE